MTCKKSSQTHYDYKKNHGDNLHSDYLICHISKREGFLQKQIHSLNLDFYLKSLCSTNIMKQSRKNHKIKT